jgi:OmpR family response regulator RpaB
MESFEKKILVVDNENNIRRGLSIRLATFGYTVFFAATKKKGLFIFNKEKPDLIILNIFLPNSTGYEVCNRVRAKNRTPIIILTSLDAISARVLGLELGIDDYLLKPLLLKELEAKIRLVLIRTKISKQLNKKREPNSLRIGNLTINLVNQRVSKNNLKIKLTHLEFILLEFLIYNAGKKLSRKTILFNVWGYIPDRKTDTRVVDVYVSRLRSKLEENPKNPNLIYTTQGLGYTFQNFIKNL